MAKSKKLSKKAAQKANDTVLWLLVVIVILSVVFLGVATWRYM